MAQSETPSQSKTQLLIALNGERLGIHVLQDQANRQYPINKWTDIPNAVELLECHTLDTQDFPVTDRMQKEVKQHKIQQSQTRTKLTNLELTQAQEENLQFELTHLIGKILTSRVELEEIRNEYEFPSERAWWAKCRHMMGVAHLFNEIIASKGLRFGWGNNPSVAAVISYCYYCCWYCCYCYYCHVQRLLAIVCWPNAAVIGSCSQVGHCKVITPQLKCVLLLCRS